jgi:hypothetical protein
MLGTFDLTDHIYGEIKPTGGGWKVKQDGATNLWTSARKDSPEGISYTMSVVFDDADEASDFVAYCMPYTPDHPDFDEDVGADIPLYIRTEDWYYAVWGVVLKPGTLNKQVLDYVQYLYDVTCYLYSPYSYADSPMVWSLTSVTSLPETKSISNLDGHIASAFESLAITCTYNSAHVKNLVHSIGSKSLTICDEALSGEVWEIRGNENKVIETYIDEVSAATTFNQDVTSGTPYTYLAGVPAIGWVQLDAGDGPYYKLSGPNQATKPAKLTACIIQTGTCEILISLDGVSWTEIFDESDFYPGSDPLAVNPVEFSLAGTEYGSDIYVKFHCTTGNMFLGYIKFEVERWVEYGTVPQVPAGAIATATIDATTGSEYCDIEGDFYARRLFL